MALVQHNHVPVSVIAPLIRRWLDNYNAEHADGMRGRNQGQYKGYVEGYDSDGNLTVLAFQSGVSGGQLRRIMNGIVMSKNRHTKESSPVDYISFDTADKIVCATVGPLAWLTEPALSRHYGPLDVTYGELKRGYELPEGFDFDSLPRAKRYVWLNARQKSAMCQTSDIAA